MVNTTTHKKTIGILTGGGDVPGLNPAIRAITIRAIREGFRVFGIRRGWAGLVDLVRDPNSSLDNYVLELSEELVNKIGRTGGTFLHTSRTRPSSIPYKSLPDHLKSKYPQSTAPVDVTKDVIENLNWLGIDTLIPIGGDDTLSYAVRLHQEGVPVVGIPKTMDNDVPGTDYCIGFSTCVTRTIELTHSLRTCAGSHERILVIEVFGRYAGFTALLPTMAGAAHRCVIPEYTFDIKHLCELLVADRNSNPSRYSVVLVSEGATFKEYMFTLDLDPALHLKETGLTEELRTAFANKQCPLSQKLEIKKQKEYFRLNDLDKKRDYLLIGKNGSAIEVFCVDMVFEGDKADMYGHKKLGGIGDIVSQAIKDLTPQFNNGKSIDVLNQRLSYLVRCGNPDALDAIVPMAYGNIAMDLILKGSFGHLVCLQNGHYGHVPIDIVTSKKKLINVEKHYNTERLRPTYKNFENQCMFIMTGD